MAIAELSLDSTQHLDMWVQVYGDRAMPVYLRTFGFGLSWLAAALRRKSSASAASRRNCAIRRLPATASIRAIISTDSRTTIGLTFNGGRPMRGVLTEHSDIGKSFIKSPK